MTSAAAIIACLLAAIEITVSPDQPLPYSYVDDPLIVEIRSETERTADIQVELHPSGDGATIQQSFPATSLGPEINRWCALKGLPLLRGRWSVSVRVRAGDGESEHQAQVYRIDRPAGAHQHPLYAYGDQIDRNMLLALRSVEVRQIRIPASHPDIEPLLQEMEQLGMRAIISLDSAADPAETAATLGQRACGTIARWELTATRENVGELPGTIEVLRALSCSPPVSLGIAGTPALPEILAAVDWKTMEHLVIHGGGEGPALVSSVRDALEAQGIEAPVLEYLHSGEDPAGFPPVHIEALARGAARVGFPAQLIMKAGTLQPGLAYANGLAHGVPPAAFAGGLPPRGNARARLFAEGDSWTLAFWSEGGEGDVVLPWSPDHPLRLYDSWSNPIEVTPPEGDLWTLPAKAEIQFLRGSGGPIVKAALIAETKSAVKRLLARKDLAGVWPEPVRAALAAVGESPENEQSRVHFFALLKAFPEIEERWHAGQIARPAAVAALSELSELARTLCRLEAARGATFLEPVQDTLARCEEYASLYLTGSTITPQARARGDRLVREVRRLMDEVEYLLASGYKIEADAVAALAEWRARGLEFAAKAGPLSDQMKLPEPEPEPAPAPEPKKETTSTKKKGKKRS